MNESIIAMKKVPGFYKVGIPDGYVFNVVEVEADGTVHQINPEGERDGVLGDDGWHWLAQAEPIKDMGINRLGSISYIVGSGAESGS